MYADICWRMLTYAFIEVIKQQLPEKLKQEAPVFYDKC
jgi:hypothetical protein